MHGNKLFATRIRAVVGAMVLTVTGSAQGQPANSNWANTGAPWNNASSWTNAAVPTTADFAVFAGFGSSVFHPDLGSTDQTISGLVFNTNPLGGGYTLTSSGGGTLTINNPNTAGTNYQAIPGAFTVAGGSHTLSAVSVTVPSGPFSTGLEIASSGQLTLTSGSTLTTTSTSTGFFFEIRGSGGTLTLDNTTAGPAPVVSLPTLGQTFRSNSGGTLNFLGNATTASAFQFPTLSAGPGDINININQPTANVGATVTFAPASGTGVSIGRFNNAGTYFFSSTGVGTLGGGAGSNPTAISTSAPLTFNGVISTSGTASAPYALVTQSSAGGVTGTFANYDTVNGVVAATLVARDGPSFAALGTTAPTENTNFAPTAAQTITTLNGPVTVNTLTINPGAAGQSLNIGANDLMATGLVHSGNRDFTITAGTGTLFGASTSIREIAVLDPNAALITNASLAAGNAQVNKAGPGFLILTNTVTDQLAFGTPQRINITGGVLRMPAAFINGAGNTINFRGGVLEVDGGGQPSTFSRSLGVTIGAGFVNWRGTTTAGTSFADNGSGGFSAINGNLTVSIGGATPTPFVWGDTNTIGATTYNTPFFVIGANALLFGSTRSNSTVNWTNPLGLDAGVADLPSAMREIRVTAGTGVQADKTQITSTISGSAATSLLKTGTGTLELTGANTYAGPTVVNGGTLLVNSAAGTSGTGTGMVSVFSGGRVGGAGTIGGNLFVGSGGTVRPGNSPGNLTVGGGVTMAAGSKYGFQFAPPVLTAPADSGNSAVPGVGNSHLTVGGTLTVNPAAIFDFAGNGGSFTANFLPGQSYSFQVATAGTVVPFNITSPAQVNVTGFTAFPGFASVQWHNVGNSVYFNFTPVPEPMHMLLVCGAGAACASWIRRRRTRSFALADSTH